MESSVLVGGPAPIAWESSAGSLGERLAAGDESALALLMDRYWERLVAYTARMLGSHDAADDVVQSAFMRLWQRRHVRVADGSIAAYLYRMVRNRAIDEQRRARIRREYASERGDSGARVVATPLEEAQAEELKRKIEHALASLPKRRREVLELARFHGLTYREIGKVMGISPQTVANQMSSALSQLRVELAPYLEGRAGSGAEPGIS